MDLGDLYFVNKTLTQYYTFLYLKERHVIRGIVTCMTHTIGKEMRELIASDRVDVNKSRIDTLIANAEIKDKLLYNKTYFKLLS